MRAGTEPPAAAQSPADGASDGPRGSLTARLRTDSASRATAIAFALSLLLAIAYLVAPLMGGDLSAQMARSEFTADHPFAPIDLRWFGGVQPFGYTLWVAYPMALIGPRLVGAIAMVASTVLTARLFLRAGARRPGWGAAAAAVCQASNLAEGRVTFAAGMAFGLAALLALPSRAGGAIGVRGLTAAGILALTAGAASPVAALLLWLCAGVLLLRRRIRESLVLGLSSAIPTAVIVGLFADGGPQPFNPTDATRAALVTLFVAAVLPRRHDLVRIGALLGVVMVLAAVVLDTSVGGNAMRLSLLFAVPAVVALVDWRAQWACAAVAIAVFLQTPVTWGTLTGAGTPQTTMAYYEPMIAAVQHGAPLTGRVQIPELNGHWEAVFAARELPLARGWLRQADTKLNSDPFYGHPINNETYRAWLDLNAVQYVAVANARLTHTGNRERDFIHAEEPEYLKSVWSNDDWTLYSVLNFVSVADGPATVISQSPTRLVIDAPPNEEFVVRVRPFQWLSLDDTAPDGACISLGERWITVQSGEGGLIEIRSDHWGRNADAC